MDARDELQAELSRQRDAQDADARATQRAAEDKAKYEGEVEEMKARLNEVAQLTVQALADSGEEPMSVEVEPKPSGLAGLFGQPVRVEGWKVSWRGDDAVVCADGALFISERVGFARKYQRTSFTELIDRRLADIGAYREEVLGTQLERAFEGHGNVAEATSIRQRLEIVRVEMVRDLSRLLSDRGLSI